jgi:DNA invertase Pin-like site-specific DNA recombinase
MSDKIRSDHLARAAYVYVRQSSIQQVRDHQESRRRQLGLAGRAKQLGFSRVVVIDQDLGRSGSGLQDRPGFAQLLSAVCQGLAGGVLALEASRLARNNRDWHHLIDLCAITDTLLIDADGVYDPRQLNDRLLLGLKGSLAEFELGLLRQRARESLEDKIRRGHVVWEPAVGYVRTEDQQIEMTPDRQVQDAIAGVFRKFRELGTARQTMLWYCTENILLPEALPGTNGREIQWRLPGRMRILQILNNPCYAGAFAWGRTSTTTTVKEGRARKGGRHKQPLEGWKVLILDHHPGYISWEEFLQNRRSLEANRTRKEPGTGAAKRGSALLTGLLRCGRCGHKLFTRYGGARGDVPRYVCRGDRRNYPVPQCVAVGGLRIDEAVARAVLEAVQPAGGQAALAAMQQLEEHDSEELRSLRLALEKARYDVQRSRRQYDAVDPENRLVARELERRWNQAIEQATALERRVAEVENCRPALSDKDAERLLTLGCDLAKIWSHPAAAIELKKRVVRTVLKEIVINVNDDPPRTDLRLHWHGGVHTTLSVTRNPRGKHGHATKEEALALIRELSRVCDDREIASVLNRLGYRTGQGNSWHAARVADARCHHRLPKYTKCDDCLTMSQAAEILHVSTTVIQRLITEGKLPATQVVKCAPWIIARESLVLPAVQADIAALRGGRRRPLIRRDQLELPLK